MGEVLGDEFVTLSVSEYELKENFDDDSCVINCQVIENPGDRRFSIEAQGVGMIDAFFQGLCSRYEAEHPSLETIKFTSFSVRGLMKDANGNHASDAKAEAIVGVTNSQGDEFHFPAVSPSVSHSSLEAVLAAVEYFLNSERAYVRIYKALEHHRRTGRPEMVAKYTELLGDMVRNTSYSRAVERLKGQR
jgi:hypothetical protein